MLELHGLVKHYGEVIALDGAGLTARPGRILGFLGPNGAGKTTAMRSVFGLVALDAGSITWKGAPIDREARNAFGYMPERRGLYPKMRVGAQITWLARMHGLDPDAADAAATAVLGHLGLGERMKDRVEALSHGNQQRAQLAASLVHQPDLLVLDEPFSGLDPTGVDAMTDIVRSRAQDGATVLFSSHQLDLVEEVCDDVAIIDRGRVIVAGTLERVRSGSPHRRLEIRFSDPGVVWQPADGTPIRSGNGTRSFLVPADADPAGYLSAAGAAGTIAAFSFEPPSLSEIFREAVGR